MGMGRGISFLTMLTRDLQECRELSGRGKVKVHDLGSGSLLNRTSNNFWFCVVEMSSSACRDC